MSQTVRVILLFLICCLMGESFSEEAPNDAKAKQEPLKEEVSETAHSVKIQGVEVPYKAIAGNLLLKDEDGKVKATIFYVSYVKEGMTDKSKRPITFCFNGGPGSSSIWLHMGVFGPKRVYFNEEGYSLPPYQLVENEYSILDLTDLVFIDPVSTGYSRAAPGEDAKQFYGVDEDVDSIASFIRLYITRAERWDSPKLLAGESYGTTRAAALALNLHNEHNIYLNGIVLISSVLSFQTLNDSQNGNDLPYILSLPTYAATAMYHKKLAPELQQNFSRTIEEVKDFVIKEYSLALLKGDKIEKQERENVIQKLSRYSGLSPQYLDRANMRVPTLQFAKELLRNDGRTVGRFDSRYKGIDSKVLGDNFEYDPSADAIFGAFTATFNQYIRSELHWKDDQEYKTLAKVSPWNYGKATNQYLNVSDDLREVMTKNPAIKVFVASGYYDLATPFFATDYTFNHLGLDPNFKDHVSTYYYDAGHMMYVYKPALVKFRKDFAGWTKDTLFK